MFSFSSNKFGSIWFLPVPPLGKRRHTNIVFGIDTLAFSATLTAFAKTFSFGSFSTPKVLTFPLRPYCSMLSASMRGDRSPAAEQWIFFSFSTAQKPQRKGLAKKFLGTNVCTQMLAQMTQPLPSTPGPLH